MGVMLAEHKSARYVLLSLKGVLEKGSSQEAKTRGRHLIELLRSHIFREENVLFQVAKVALSRDEKRKISSKLRKMGHLKE